MLLAPYDPRHDSPTTPYRGDCRTGLAVEDRNLLAEAEDRDACSGAMLAAYLILYPPVRLGSIRPAINPLTN